MLTEHCAAVVSRQSMASLWVLTELHTALYQGKPISLIIDATDEALVRLLASVRFSGASRDFDTRVQFDAEALARLHAQYARENPHAPARCARYRDQVRDFLASVPVYLSLQDRPRHAFAYPEVPQNWGGPIPLTNLGALRPRMPTGAATAAEGATPARAAG